MARIKWLCAVLLITLVVISSTGFAFSWGSGRVLSETRTVPAFQSIDLKGSAEVYLRQGAKQALEVRTDDNLLKLLETRVENGTLRIGFREGVAHVSVCEIQITMPRVQKLNISGSGSIQGQNKIQAGDVFINISGSGDLALDLEARQVTARISGSGHSEISGKAEVLNADISGSGELSAFAFPVREANLTISGSGDGQINAAQTLNVRISGSGNVEYKGNPRMNAQTSGSGKIQAVH